MFSNPKITCITINCHEPNLNRAIASFKSQTYPNKELVVLSQSEEAVEGDDIQFIHFRANKSLATMQNLAVEIATGDWICLWEASSFSHPHRLANQFRAINGFVASGYSQFLRIAGNNLYWGNCSHELLHNRRVHPDTLMFKKDCLGIFKGFLFNDGRIVDKLLSLGQIALLDNGYQYVCSMAQLNENLGSIDLLEMNRTLIEETLQLGLFQGPIDVRTATEIAYKGLA